ncbi:MAG: TonB-dependent receptor [Bacteroidota bacterium]
MSRYSENTFPASTWLFPPGFFSALVLLGFSIGIHAQYTVHGTVYDQATGEHLVAATVYDTLSKSGTVSNEYGFFSLNTTRPEVVLNCSYVGYSTIQLSMQLDSDTGIDISLNPNLELEEVTVSAQSSERDFKSSQMSAHNISRMQLNKIPLLFGETDLIKALQYLPGVSSGLEGTSGIYVRGGGTDQNLILLDGVPVYNVNHLFGIFSVFNGDAINNATLYKGGFPARYSGRLSSVLDIQMKEGNMKEFHGSASIGLIGAKLMLEGPIIKDRTSFLVSARRTYADVLSYPVQYMVNKRNHRSTNSYFGYYFYDLNAKINHKFSENSRLYLSTYAGKDEFYTKDAYTSLDYDTQEPVESKYREGFNWGNWTTALRWNYIWTSRLFSNTTLSYSTYKFKDYDETQVFITRRDTGNNASGFQSGQTARTEQYYSGIRDLSARLDFSFTPSGSHTLRFGAKGTSYMFEPGVSITDFEWEAIGHGTSITGADTIRAKQFTAYVEDDFQLGSKFKSNVGISTTLFNVKGKTYYTFEPRISARYLISDKLVLKASFAKMSQPLHLLTNATIGLPTDIWVPTTSTLAPEVSWQTALGVKYKTNTGFNFSIEGFYKEMENLVEYAEGEEIFLNDKHWESRILSGSGTAYGLEFFAEKTAGRLTGSVAYTLSKNSRQFDDVNNGEPFPYKYDRRHDISIVANYKLKENISMGAVWVYGSGINITTLDQSYYNPLMILDHDPESDYPLRDNDIIRNFSERNGYKLPAYHRLDIGFNFEKQKKRVKRTWSVGAYNVYARKNAFYIYGDKWHDQETNQMEQHVTQVTLLPFVPYVRYAIRF